MPCPAKCHQESPQVLHLSSIAIVAIHTIYRVQLAFLMTTLNARRTVPHAHDVRAVTLSMGQYSTIHFRRSRLTHIHMYDVFSVGFF